MITVYCIQRTSKNQYPHQTHITFSNILCSLDRRLRAIRPEQQQWEEKGAQSKYNSDETDLVKEHLKSGAIVCRAAGLPSHIIHHSSHHPPSTQRFRPLQPLRFAHIFKIGKQHSRIRGLNGFSFNKGRQTHEMGSKGGTFSQRNKSRRQKTDWKYLSFLLLLTFLSD